MKISVLGSGNIGRRLTKYWAEAGHEVMLGTRTVDDDAREMAAELQSQIGTHAEAAAHGVVVALAIPGNALEPVVTSLDLSDKIIIDATNFSGSDGKSGAERIAEWAPNATVYKAFNTTGAENFDKPELNGMRVDMLFSGADGDTRQTVAQLISDIGFNPIYAGGIEKSALLEAVARLWISMVFEQGYSRRMSFKLLMAENNN